MSNDDINDIKRNWLIAITVLITFILISIVISPLFETGEWTDKLARKYEYRINASKTIGLIFGGIIGLVNIVFAARRAYAMEESAKAANDKQITERFAKAIEQLASEKIEVRLGAIYTLERIAKDSEKDQWTIMEVLTAFVRENAPVKKEEKSQNKKSFIDEFLNTQNNKETEELPKLRLDIQECLTVIGRREHLDPENKRLDLSNVNISKANLSKANLSKANLSEANLSEANLSGANLSGFNFSGFNFSEFNFSRADLIGADLTGADLTGANLTVANLTGANLTGANLTGANLTGTDRSGFNFIEAKLSGFKLSGVKVSGADLTGAILKGATMPDGSIHD